MGITVGMGVVAMVEVMVVAVTEVEGEGMIARGPFLLGDVIKKGRGGKVSMPRP